MLNTIVVNFWLKTPQDEKQQLSGSGTITISGDDHVTVTHTALGKLLTCAGFFNVYIYLSGNSLCSPCLFINSTWAFQTSQPTSTLDFTNCMMVFFNRPEVF